MPSTRCGHSPGAAATGTAPGSVDFVVSRCRCGCCGWPPVSRWVFAFDPRFFGYWASLRVAAVFIEHGCHSCSFTARILRAVSVSRGGSRSSHSSSLACRSIAAFGIAHSRVARWHLALGFSDVFCGCRAPRCHSSEQSTLSSRCEALYFALRLQRVPGS